MKTTITSYYYQLPEDAQAYDDLCKNMKQQGVKCFETHGGNSHYNTAFNGDVTLSTDNVFDNQWNATLSDGKKYRVFDWAQDYIPNKNIKKGHYLIVTQEMRELRDSTYKCGYCGAYHKTTGICDKCLDSEYLEPDNLQLLKLLPVSSSEKRTLTPDQLRDIMPLYEEGRRKVNARKKAKEIEHHNKAMHKAKVQHEAMLWILENTTLSTNNVIMYDTGVFTFGWRNSIPQDNQADILERMEGFPYEVKFK